MRRLTRSLLIAVAAPCLTGAQQPLRAAHATTSTDGYAPDSTSFVVGKRVYLRSSKTYIGTIVRTAEQHDFRAGHFRRPWMKAVLIERRDGPHEWVPVEGITRIYVVR